MSSSERVREDATSEGEAPNRQVHGPSGVVRVVGPTTQEPKPRTSGQVVRTRGPIDESQSAASSEGIAPKRRTLCR